MEVTPKTLNTSWDENNPTVKTALNLYDILIPTIGSVIILLNLGVVVSSGLILKKGQQPRSTYLFLGNVAMTDLLTGIAVVFGQLYPKSNRDHYICSLQIGMIVSSTLASVYSIGLIAIDRFLYILHGIQYQSWVYPTRARLLIAFTWILGCITGFMPLFGWHGDTDNGRVCWFILLAPKNLILTTVILGVIPLIIVIILYSIILYHAIKKIMHLQTNPYNQPTNNNTTNNLRMFRGGRRVSLQTPPPEPKKKQTFYERIFKPSMNNNVKSPSKWKAIKVVLFTTVSFSVCWCPYFVASIIYVYTCENNKTKRCGSISLIIASPLAILGFSNSLINPIIYAWWHKGFRTYVQQRVSIVIEKARRASNAVANVSYQISRRASRKESTASTFKADHAIPTIFVVEEENTTETSKSTNLTY